MPALERGRPVKHTAKIEPGTSREFTLPLATLEREPHSFDSPEASEWDALPERFLDGIELSSKFIGSAKGQSLEWLEVEYAHVLGGKMIATNNRAIIEYDTGKCDLACTLTVKQVRMIKAFGTAPTHAAMKDALHLKWANGNSLELVQQFRPTDTLNKLFEPFDWEGFTPVDENWRAQVVGHFSFKPIRDNDGLMTIYPDRITGGVFDNRADVELRIETRTDQEVVFEQATFLDVVKVATEIKFVHYGDHSRLLVKGENLRGFAVSRQRVPL
jgi:hypothetical protein